MEGGGGGKGEEKREAVGAIPVELIFQHPLTGESSHLRANVETFFEERS